MTEPKEAASKEPTVKVRVLFDNVSYTASGETRAQLAVKGDEIELPKSQYERLMSEEASLPAIPQSLGGTGETRFPVEKL